jgi:hypothetical protein
VDLEQVRAKVAAEMKRVGLNPTRLADKADVNQSGLAKWLRTTPATSEGMTVRVLFQVIERGLGLTVSSFFAQIEGLNLQVTSGDNLELQGPSRPDGENLTIPSPRDSQVVLRELSLAFFAASRHANRATTKSLFAELAFVCRATADAGPEAAATRPRATRGRGRHRGDGR